MMQEKVWPLSVNVSVSLDKKNIICPKGVCTGLVLAGGRNMQLGQWRFFIDMPR